VLSVEEEELESLPAAPSQDVPGDVDNSAPEQRVEALVRAPWMDHRRTLGGAAIGFCAAGLWLRSLPDIDPGNFDDIGLVPALPFVAYLALILLTIGFSAAITDRVLNRALLLIYLSLLMFMVYGVTAVIEGTTRFNAAWRHTGIIDYIMRNGSVDPNFDAYFNWPVFFILGALFTEVTGLSNLLGFAAWVSVLLNAMYLLPLVVIVRSSTSDPRLPWLAAWIFLLTNWVGQDYFSPQGFNFFLELCLVAILLRWFRIAKHGSHLLLRIVPLRHVWARVPRFIRTWLAPADVPSATINRWQRNALLVSVVAIFVVINGSHQLTPFAAFFAVSVLVAFNRCSVRWLPIIMLLLIALWLQFMATAYLASQGQALVADVGDVANSLDQTATKRLSGSPGHLFIVRINLAFTLVVWGAAFLGGIRRAIAGYRDVTLALLAVAPFLLVPLQSYGGEMLLRVYFFALPFMAFFVAALLLPTEDAGRSRWMPIIMCAISLGLLGGLLLTRYGNEKMNYYTHEEIAAANYLYTVAPTGSWVVTANWNVPLRHQGYDTYRYAVLRDMLSETAPSSGIDPLAEVFGDDVLRRTIAPAIANLIAERLATRADGTQLYLYISRSQTVANRLLGLSSVPPDVLAKALAATGRFRVTYSNQDGTVLELANQAFRGGLWCGWSPWACPPS